MEGHFLTGQSPQWAVVRMEEEEEEEDITTISLFNLHCYVFRHFRVTHQGIYNQCVAKLHTFFKLQLLETQFIN